MHYRNGREAKNGDEVVQLSSSSAKVEATGKLFDASAEGGDHCNGKILSVPQHYGPAMVVGACLCDCLHADDVAAILAEKGLDKRPPGK